MPKVQAATAHPRLAPTKRGAAMVIASACRTPSGESATICRLDIRMVTDRMVALSFWRLASRGDLCPSAGLGEARNCERYNNTLPAQPARGDVNDRKFNWNA